MKIKTVKTKRLVLRDLDHKDYEDWFHYSVNRRDPQNIWDLKPQPKHKCTKVEFKRGRQRSLLRNKMDERYRLWIFTKKDNVLVGQIDFHIYERGHLEFANFGYAISDRYWGHGYGREAARAGLFYGFKYLNLNRLEACIDPKNKKSIDLAKRIGMRKEGIKKRYYFQSGKWMDQMIYVANPEDIGLKGKRPKK